MTEQLHTIGQIRKKCTAMRTCFEQLMDDYSTSEMDDNELCFRIESLAELVRESKLAKQEIE